MGGTRYTQRQARSVLGTSCMITPCTPWKHPPKINAQHQAHTALYTAQHHQTGCPTPAPRVDSYQMLTETHTEPCFAFHLHCACSCDFEWHALVRGSAAKQTHMPAAFPAATPAMASSNTRQQLGSACGEKAAAAVRNISGAGLPFVTWSPAAVSSAFAGDQPPAGLASLAAEDH
jgi:hypothetical protein